MSLNDVSHGFTRKFQPQKLVPPRDFATLDASFWQSKQDAPHQKPLQRVSRTLSQQVSQESGCLPDDTPLVLEIGAGKGKHACLYALNNPQSRLIAIERTREKFDAFAKQVRLHRQQGEPLANLLPVHADAIAFTVYALAPASLSSIYLLYPNPERNNPNQQWLNMPFFEFLLSRLQQGGNIILASNVADYIEHAMRQADEVWRLPVQCSIIRHDSARTHFEIKYLARGEVCQEMVMTKPRGYRTHFDGWQVADMPTNAICESPNQQPDKKDS